MTQYGKGASFLESAMSPLVLMPPLASIVITSHNQERFLSAAIESVLTQSYPHFELLIWDDGSTDQSLAIAHYHARRDQRIRVIAASHQGRVCALKQAFAVTTGTYLCYVDSDDLLAPTALAETLAILEAQPEIGWVYTDYLDMQENGQILGYGSRCRIPYSRDRLLVDFMTFQFRLMRRSTFEQAGGIDASMEYAEDYDLCLRLSEVARVTRLRRPLYYYRHHAQATSQQKRLSQILSSQRAIAQALKRRGMADRYAIEVSLPDGKFTLRRKTPPIQPAKLIPLLASFPLAGAMGMGIAQAQSIIPAGDGTNTVVVPSGDRLDISGGQLSGNGANLFHSFQQFGLNQGQIANFLSNPQIQNILGRVVGGDASVINGLIQVTGGTSNLYLMNPAGIVFGPNARLNVPASFTATTASGIGFNNGWFNASGTSDYATLTGNPNRFAFATNQPGSLINAGNLAVGLGQSLGLVGGTVLNIGQLTAPEGQIVLTAVAGENLVRLNQPGSLLSLEVSPLSTSSSSPPPLPFTPLTLAQLLTGGSLGNATGLTVNPNGTIQLQGSQMQIPMAAGTAIASGRLDTSGQIGGQINILGSQVGVIGATVNVSGVTGSGTILIGGDYQGQGTVPNATQTFVDPNSVINASSLVRGNGGRVIVWADNATQFWGTINAQGGAQGGDGGFVEVSGKEFLTFQGNVNVLAANGNAGTLLLDPSTLTIIDALTGGDLDGFLPNILFATPDVGANTVSWGAIAAADANILLQATGDITINPIVGATPGVTTPGFANLSLGPAGSFTLTSSTGAVRFVNTTDTIRTDQGSVTISGSSLVLGNIDTRPFSGFSPNNGGNVTLTASSGTLTVGNIDTSSNGLGSFGNGGNITLNASGSITAGDLIGNGYGGTAGAITVTSTTGAINVGNIAATGVPFGGTSGNTVTLTTASNGGDISFGSIDTRGNGFEFEPPTNGGDVVILARGQVRGTGQIAATSSTIATNSLNDRTNGTVTIQHDGGPNNVPFNVGDASVTVTSGNGLFGAIDTGAETITAQTFPFSPNPFVSPGGSIQITFLNTGPTLTANSPLVGAQQDTPFNFTTATLNPVRLDANDDNPTSVFVTAIAAGAVLRINGSVANPGDVLPPGANLEFVPPAGFQGTLDSAFVLSATDGIETVTKAIAIQVNPQIPPPPDDEPDSGIDSPCILAKCANPSNQSPDWVQIPTVTLDLTPNPEEGFTREYEEYLGLAPVRIRSRDELKDISLQIEKSTGAKPAFIYVSFIPAEIPPKITVQTKSLEPNGNGQKQLTDELEVIAVTARGNPIRKRIPEATREKVMAVAQQFRSEVADPRKTRSKAYLQPAQQLYQWIIAPLQADLEAQGIDNLVFMMESGLRSLPVAALHDGERFLVEKYSMGTMPSLSLTDTRYQDIKDSKILGLGISESTQGQPPLPAVPIEMTEMSQFWAGRLVFNTNATLSNLIALRQQQPFGIIHLATHADFQPGTISNSYIQLWEDKLRLNQVRDLGWNNPQVELLVLSACATALGDREAELGFGGLAVQTGVKTAVASLWYVSDAATAALMTGFYRDLRTARIKAEALQQAQLAMAKGQIYVENNRLQGVGMKDGIPLPEGVTVRDRQLSHPFYWSAFTMIGSPW